MEVKGTLEEIRRLVGELRKLEKPSKKTPKSPVLTSLIGRVNQLTATCPLPSVSFRGFWRKGPHAGSEWGAWHPNPDSSAAFSLGSSSDVCKLQFLPTIAGAIPNVRLGARGWAVFSTGGRDMDVHRQLWQDCWGCTLPEWVHVHHCADGPRRKLDNGLRNLELRDWIEHGREHGREGGKAGGKGREQQQPNLNSRIASRKRQLSSASSSNPVSLPSSSSAALPQRAAKRRKNS